MFQASSSYRLYNNIVWEGGIPSPHNVICISSTVKMALKKDTYIEPLWLSLFRGFSVVSLPACYRGVSVNYFTEKDFTVNYSDLSMSQKYNYKNLKESINLIIKRNRHKQLFWLEDIFLSFFIQLNIHSFNQLMSYQEMKLMIRNVLILLSKRQLSEMSLILSIPTCWSIIFNWLFQIQYQKYIAIPWRYLKNRKNMKPAKKGLWNNLCWERYNEGSKADSLWMVKVNSHPVNRDWYHWPGVTQITRKIDDNDYFSSVFDRMCNWWESQIPLSHKVPYHDNHSTNMSQGRDPYVDMFNK